MDLLTASLTQDLFPHDLLPPTPPSQLDMDGFRRAARGLPEEFIALLDLAVLHRDPQRFALLYRLLWRLQHEPALRQQPLDPDLLLASQMAQAVRRDMHQMKAGLQFRRVQDDSFRSHPEGGPLHVGWFAPEHHIAAALAPFFARRFRQMRWAILTPECSIEWDGNQLGFGPGAQPDDAPAPNAGAQVWHACYRQIFQPARLRLKLMQKSRPRSRPTRKAPLGAARAARPAPIERPGNCYLFTS